ncbi:hypothetical protein KAR91_61685 [Candidatus Pacearchaeota archaeon]|nr:hypothetical protein [Candidatus Pacearchaeota archaeon]
MVRESLGLFGGTPLVDAIIDRKKLFDISKRDEALLKLQEGVTTVKQPAEAAKIVAATALGLGIRRL